MITALCGGVGGSKLASGLYRILPPDALRVVVNTADDLELWALHISPDLDTVTYALAGVANHRTGWGIEGDTFQALDMMRRFGAPDWFQIGDRDLATDVLRTHHLREKQTLTDVTAQIVSSLGVKAQILPMTDQPVATKLLAGGEWIDFQEYFVHRRHAVPVGAVRYQGAEDATATEQVVQALREAEAIVLVSSNPVLSILPILAIPGIREGIRSSAAPCVAVSPMIGDDSLTGPAGELMGLIDLPSTSTGVAAAYRGVIDGIVIDRADARQAGEIEAIGIAVLCTDITMRSDADRERLAGETLAFARSLA